jgi:hypothetical protein
MGGSLGGLLDVVAHQDVTYVRWANGVGATTTSGAVSPASTQTLLGALAASRIIAPVALGALAAAWAARQGWGGMAVSAWWLGCDLATVMLSARGFTHYVQQAEAALALVAALLAAWALRRYRTWGVGLAALVMVAAWLTCELVLWLPRAEVATALGWPLPSPELHNFRALELPRYYLRTWQHLTGAISEQDYERGFPGHVGRKLAMVSLFVAHSRPGQRVFVWGAVPWVYALSNRLPAGRYVTLNSAYYLDPEAETKLLRDLAHHPPAVLVVDHPPPPDLWLLLHSLRYRVIPQGVAGDDYWLAPWARS